MRDLTYRFVNVVGRGLLSALDVRIRAHGVTNLPRSGPVILAANHVSYVDFVIIGKSAAHRGRFVRFLARYDSWVPATAWALNGMGHIPVDRAAPAGAFLTARDNLRRGEAVGLFPEAGISYSFTVRDLMNGAAALAAQTGAPIIPVTIWGSQRIYTVGIPEPKPDLTRGRLVDVDFGEPITWAGEPVADLTTRLGHHLSDTLERLQRLPEHAPRAGERAPWHPAHLGGHAPTRRQAEGYDVVPARAVKPTWGPLD